MGGGDASEGSYIVDVELARVDVDEDALSVAVDIAMDRGVDIIWCFVSWFVRKVCRGMDKQGGSTGAENDRSLDRSQVGRSE